MTSVRPGRKQSEARQLPQDVLAAITRFRCRVTSTTGLTGNRAAHFDRYLFADHFGNATRHCVGNSFAHTFLALDLLRVMHRFADRVRYHFDALLLHHATAGVGDFSGTRLGDHFADFVAAGLDPFFGNHAADLIGAGSRFRDHFADFVACLVYTYISQRDRPILRERSTW